MENSLKGLLMASGIMITCVIISLGFYMMREAENTASQTMEYLAEFNKELSEEGLVRYDGEEVMGSDVVNFIRRELGAYKRGETSFLTIYVKTGLSEYEYKDGSYLTDIRTHGNDRYINPLGVFSCTVERDDNDVINKICFVQK